MKVWSLLLLGPALLIQACSENGKVLFTDQFGSSSQGELRENVVQLSPPEGLGFTWKVLPAGYDPVNWTLVDELETDDPKKGFWVIPPDSFFLQQGGRSHNSVLFCNVPVPENITDYDIRFRQYREDNDYIGFLVGADSLTLYGGFEFGYMTQVPGTDSTTSDAFISGALGEHRVEGAAFMHVWADHLIEIRSTGVSWFMNDRLMVSGEMEGTTGKGYFGIRQRYDRNTRYDDFHILIR